MRILIIFLIISLAHADILDREDVQDFINIAVDSSELTKEEIEKYLIKAVASEKAITARQNQPEVKATWSRYRNRYVTFSRINNGARFVKENYEILESVEKDFGVSKFYVASIIGCETNYGSFLGTYNPLDTIFTRAFEPKNSFWQKELIQLLILSKKYNFDPKAIKSSWSGALGLGQFIPSSYNYYGVDYDNDGMVDMYNSKKDGIASVANYLKENGWKTGSNAVIEVNVGKKYEKLQDDDITELTFPFNLNNFRTKITVAELLEEGFEFDDKFNEKISPLLVYEQGKTKLYLGFDNFRVITKYNRSSKYALAVHQLALEISKKFDD
ncbi:MAG: lytic murein transglycosylase [Gammaproteobacteria bacterium TMED112]|nr:MAG: lytic murein transglycosylase [Gammaproteobacteria bacterium TMED112]|tara:strand:+ start:24034 stop:25017 length:984 start_codon:yes stop_codon:yes gene_type:complete